MNHLATLNELDMPDAEEEFFAGLQDRHDPGLVHWARSYHFFSTSQAKLLALVVCSPVLTDPHSLSEVTKALCEEYGSGSAEAVHSRLFARFCEALGLSPATLPVPRAQVEPGVLQYLDAIEAGYRSSDLAVTLGTYCFLERSAVLSYPLMLQRLRALGFSPADLVFFSTHVVQEAAHDAGAHQMAERLIRSERDAQGFNRQLHRMQEAWTDFWRPFAVQVAHAD